MGDMTNEQKPYTASSLAKAAGVHNTYVSRLCRQGKIPAVMVGNSWIISNEVGQKWLEEREAKQKPEQPEN